MSETFQGIHGEAARGEVLSSRFFRHSCANSSCPDRGKPWLRWLHKTEIVEFAGKRYCCAECAEPALQQGLQRRVSSVPSEKARPHRVPLGLLLVSRGVIGSDQLQQAVRRQQANGGQRLGRCLLEMGVLSEAALTAALGLQWGCPVFPLEGSQAYRECAQMVPSALLQSAGALPVHYSPTNQILHLAFTHRIDHTLLYAVERMLGCRAMACVAAESAVAVALQDLRRLSLSQESVFDSVKQPHEMARMAAYYAGKLRASRLQVVRAAEQVWFRFENSHGTHHLLFQDHIPDTPEGFER